MSAAPFLTVVDLLGVRRVASEHEDEAGALAARDALRKVGFASVNVLERRARPSYAVFFRIGGETFKTYKRKAVADAVASALTYCGRDAAVERVVANEETATS